MRVVFLSSLAPPFKRSTGRRTLRKLEKSIAPKGLAGGDTSAPDQRACLSFGGAQVCACACAPLGPRAARLAGAHICAA